MASAVRLRARGRVYLSSLGDPVVSVGQPPELLAIHAVSPADGGKLIVETDLFVGVTAFEAVQALHRRGRRLPIEVWARVADELLAGLEAVSPGGYLPWPEWWGPRAFGVELDGRVALFQGVDGLPRGTIQLTASRADREWVRSHTLRAGERDAAGNAVLALIWLLEAYPLADDAVRSGGWDRRLTHPDLTAPLRRVLEQAAATGSSLAELRAALATSGPVPAPAEVVAATFFGACPEVLVRRSKAATGRNAVLPPAWQNGGLAVAVDRALESCASPDGTPADPLGATQGAGPVGLGSMPLLPTPALSLELAHVTPTGRRFLNNVKVLGAVGLPPRVWVTAHGRPPAGSPLVLTLRHPLQPDASVQLAGTVSEEGDVIVGAAADQASFERLMTALSPLAKRDRRSVVSAGAPGAIDSGSRSLVRLTSISVGLLLAALAVASFVPWLVGVVPAVALLTVMAVIALRGVAEHWPFGNVVSAALFLLAAGAAAMSPDTWAVVPALAVMALMCAWSIGRHDHQGSRLLASRHFRRALTVPHATKCDLCKRAHLNGARFTECQYGNCRNALEARHTCTCDGCVALDAIGQKRESRAFRERLEKIGDGRSGGAE